MFHSLRMRLVRAVGLALPAALGLGALGCSGDDSTPGVTCKRDEALIAERRPCRGDDDCPCGAGCVLGECVADCLVDVDCGSGSRCDQFGRCRAATDRERIPALAPPDGPSALTTVPVLLRFAETDTEQVLTLRPGDAAGMPVRVLADDGVEIRCSPDGDFVAECSFELSGEELDVGVRLTGSIGPDDARRVRVFYADRELTVSVTDQPEGDRPLPDEDRLLAGTYAGTAVLMAVGVSADPADAGRPADGLAVPLEARLFLGGAGTGTLVLDDPLGVFAPGGRWVGAVTESGAATGSVDFPTVAYLDGELTPGAPTEVLLDAPPAEYSAGGSGFHFQLRTRFDGVLMGDRRPFAVWDVALSRTGELPSGDRPPAVPADAVATLATTRGQNPTPWESALGGAATPNPTSIVSRTVEEKAVLLETYGRQGSGGTLEACNLPATVAGSLAQAALNTSWGPEPESGLTRVPPIELTSSGLPVVSRLASVLSTQPAVSVSAVLRPSTPARTLPCAASFARTDTTFTGACGPDESQSFLLGTIDLCDAMASAYGCELVDVSDETLSIDARISYEDSSACVRTNAAVTLSGDVTRACRLPVVPAACSEMALCYEPPATGGTDRASVDAPFLGGTTPLPVSGDLHCLGGERTAAIDADVNAERPVDDPERLDATELIDDCALNLSEIRDEAAPTLGSYGAGLREGFRPGVCMDSSRLLYAIGLATDGDRRRALGDGEPVQPLASALANRLIQRWLTQHAYAARESAETEPMAQVFRSGGRPGDPILPPVDEVLAGSLAGWQLLLHPRFATAIEQLPAATLVDPDYRPLAAGGAVTTQAHHEQPVSLPVTMLETLAAQLALLVPRMEEAALSRNTTALPSLAGALRHAAVVWPMAAQLAARAEAYALEHGAADPAWLERYAQAERSLRASLGRLTATAMAVTRGENPLGISDDDTPLYFLGDETGASSRFSAISDFLLGDGPGSSAWAPTMVARATASLEDARTAWMARREREVQLVQSSAELAGKLDDIRAQYGERLSALCGKPGLLATNQLLEEWTDFDPNSCFVRADSPSCGFDPTDYARMMNVGQVQFQLCVVGEVRRTMGFIVGFADDTLNQIADRIGECATPRYPVACPGGDELCVECRTSLGTLTARVSPDTFRQVGGLAAVGHRVVEDAVNACKRRFPGAETTLPGPDDLPDSPSSRVDCFSGAMGEAVFEIRAAQQDLELANSAFGEHQANYDIAMKHCLIQQVGDDRIDAANAAHNTTMTILRAAKLVADLAATAAGAVKDCATAIDVISDALTFTARAGVACAATAVGAAATAVSQGLAFGMEEANQLHATLISSIQDEISHELCFNDAEMHLVGQQTAALRIERAMTDVERASYRLEEMKTQAGAIFEDGRAALAAARDRFVPPLSHDEWLDEPIESFLGEMRIARRLVYLAARAVEYETQQSLALEGEILAAQHPNQLEAALDELWASAGTRTVAGRRPTDLKVVLSLREELLQLADRSMWSETEQRLTDVERFRLLIQSPRFAVFDRTGAYLGQEIPFDLVPLGALRLGAYEGIAVLAANDCAERVWSVNASILGADDLYVGGSPTFTRLDLLKQNTFFSQWCSAAGAGDPFQVASVRPSHNLFRDPVYGGDYGSDLGPLNEAQQYTRARIEAYFNVDRESFEADDYANGETSELAARGLYGRYALFLPAGVLSLAGSRGLALNKVDDILLRLDYVSVAR